MGGFVDAIFNPGGAAKDASKAQQTATRQAMQEYKRGIKEAKNEIMPAAAEAERERTQRTREAIELQKYGFAPSLDVLNQGNMNAQQMIAGGGQNAMSAILGGAIDPTLLQPQGINFNPTNFLSGLDSLYQIQPPEPVDVEATMDVGMPSDNQLIAQLGSYLAGGGTPAPQPNGGRSFDPSAFNGGNVNLNPNAAGRAVFNPTMRLK